MLNILKRYKYLDFMFYIYENEKYKQTILMLMQLLKIVKPNQMYFGEYSKIILDKYSEVVLKQALDKDWTDYNDYILHIEGIKEQVLGLRISPFLKEVSIVKIRIEKRNYEKNRNFILSLFNKMFENGSFMMGFGDPSVYNPYFERGRGKIYFGAHWIMWFGNWALKYLNNYKLQLIEESTCKYTKSDYYVKAEICIHPWRYRKKVLFEKYRKFMKKIQFEDVVMQYNRDFKFTEIQK